MLGLGQYVLRCTGRVTWTTTGPGRILAAIERIQADRPVFPVHPRARQRLAALNWQMPTCPAPPGITLAPRPADGQRAAYSQTRGIQGEETMLWVSPASPLNQY
jgi:hypothetical protein